MMVMIQEVVYSRLIHQKFDPMVKNIKQGTVGKDGVPKTFDGKFSKDSR